MELTKIKGGFSSGDNFIGAHPEIIGKRKSTIFWKMKNYWKVTNLSENKKILVKPEYLSGEEGQFIAYLYGLTLAKIIEKTGGLIQHPFHLQKRDYGIRENLFWKNHNPTRGRVISEKSPSSYNPGYYLLWYIENGEDFVIPDSWRKATLAEASEAIQTIHKVSAIRLLENKMFVAKEEADKVWAIGKFQEGSGLEVWYGKKEIFNNNYKKSLLLIHK